MRAGSSANSDRKRSMHGIPDRRSPQRRRPTAPSASGARPARRTCRQPCWCAALAHSPPLRRTLCAAYAPPRAARSQRRTNASPSRSPPFSRPRHPSRLGARLAWRRWREGQPTAVASGRRRKVKRKTCATRNVFFRSRDAKITANNGAGARKAQLRRGSAEARPDGADRCLQRLCNAAGAHAHRSASPRRQPDLISRTALRARQRRATRHGP